MDRLQAQVRSLRSGLEPYAHELDCRRHDILHVKRHIRRLVVLLAGGGAALGVAAGLVYVLRRRDALRRIA